MIELFNKAKIKTKTDKKFFFLFLTLVPIAFIGGCTRAIAPLPKAGTFINDKVQFLGKATFPTGFKFQGTEIGGLSGITYDELNQVYYAISDDRSQKAPARFYTLKIDLNPAIVTPVAVTTLLDETGKPFAPLSLDPEGIALDLFSATLFIASEGDADRKISPFIKGFLLGGKQIKTLPVPEKFLPVATRTKGIRNNLAFESLTITRDRRFLYTATENALLQDGLEADTRTGSPCRILQYNLSTGKPEKEFLYITDPVAADSNLPNGLANNGLVDLLAVNDTQLLTLERSYSQGVGNTIRLFEVSLEKANDIRSIDSLSASDRKNIQPAQKRLLLDLKAVNFPVDNIEGLTFGSQLPDGRRSLVLVSDNNFNPQQVTQVLVFAILN